ncbi:MAG: tail fiber domain-containing protein, partial [Chloroflexota bacterium]
DRATVSGGYGNQATAENATVPGGYLNEATALNSFAAGQRAKANHEGSFVWADNSTDADFASDTTNQFKIRAYSGLHVADGVGNWVEINGLTQQINANSGAYLSWGGTWTNASDRKAKENMATVDGQEILDRLAEVPITSWNYKVEDEAVKHIGPTAQDFYAAFGLGDSDTAIGTVDADGVSLAAVQALYERSQQLEAENAALRDKVADNAARLAELENMVDGGAKSQFSTGIFLPAGAFLLIGLIWVGIRIRQGVIGISPGGNHGGGQ